MDESIKRVPSENQFFTNIIKYPNRSAIYSRPLTNDLPNQSFDRINQLGREDHSTFYNKIVPKKV